MVFNHRIALICMVASLRTFGEKARFHLFIHLKFISLCFLYCGSSFVLVGWLYLFFDILYSFKFTLYCTDKYQLLLIQYLYVLFLNAHLMHLEDISE